MVRTKWHQIERTRYPAGLWALMMAVLTAFMLVMSPPASAAAGKRVAFVVGIGTYDHLPSHQQLKNPLNDAGGVSKKLTDIGFQVVKAPNLTRSDFNARWQDVLHGLDKKDTFVLYFSGHGVQVDGQNYLLPRDIPYIKYGRQAQLTREAISLDQLLADLSTGDRPHPKRSVVILDACRDNPLIPQEFKGGATRGGLAKLPEPNGIFVIYSAGSNKTALDRLSPSDPVKYSVFTRVLLPLMDRTDLTIQTLSIELREQVAKLAEDAGHAQQPAYYDGIRGRFCLPGCAALSESSPPPATTAKLEPRQMSQDREITGKDGAPMVLIPAGEFQMGSPDGERDKDEHPRHNIALSALYLDKSEVTNRLFQQFVQQTNHLTTAEREGKAFEYSDKDKWKEVSGAHWRKPDGGETVFDFHREEHPVVSVSWEDAQAYCSWAGKRLPTEAEFEYATRAGAETKYWWGNGNPGSRRVANIADESARRQYSDWPIMTGYDDGYVRTAPVGSFEPNPFGLHDMTGNVWEWTDDWYDEQYYVSSSRKNPSGPSGGTKKVFRGGSWTNKPSDVRSARRRSATPTESYVSIGFRCAQDNPK